MQIREYLSEILNSSLSPARVKLGGGFLNALAFEVYVLGGSTREENVHCEILNIPISRHD